MSMLLLNQHHKGPKPNAHSNQNEPEPPPETSAPPQLGQGEQDHRGASAKTQQPTDLEARREKALKDAQAQWAQRRKDGYEDYGAEMGKDARIWETYVKETDRSDHELIEGWNKSVLTLSNSVAGCSTNIRKHILGHTVTVTEPFAQAALFSAVSTAFVIASSEDLQQDPADTSAQTLLAISQALVAISNGQPANASATAEQDSSTSFKPTRAAVIVNTLWFFSLSLSIAVSLVAMLAKEWCYSFMANRTGQTYEQGRRRQERWNGILRWKMKDVIAFLPMVMHSALFLFALGLCVYLWSICVPVALPVVVTTGVALLIYFSTTALPLLFDFCPYTTESSKLIHSYLVLISRGTSALLNHMVQSLHSKSVDTHKRFHNWERLQRRLLSTADSILFFFAEALERFCPGMWLTPEKTVLIVDPKFLIANGKVPMDNTTSEMVAWLLANSEDSRVTTIALQSLAGADPWLPRLPLLQNGALRLLNQCLEGSLDLDGKQDEYRLRDQASVHSASLYMRGLNFILSFHNSEGCFLEFPSFHLGGHSYYITDLFRVQFKNTWNEDVDTANIDLLTAGTHGSKFTLSIDFDGLPDLALFGNLHPQAIRYTTGLTIPHYVDHAAQHLETLALLGQYVDETIVVHTHTITTIVRRETELLCARYAERDEISPKNQLAFPITLLKLSCLPSIQKHLETLHAIAVALAITAFVLVEDSLQKYPSTDPSHGQSRPSVVASYHYRPKILANHWNKYLSLEASRRKETESLLMFGLLALFEHPDAHSLCDADIVSLTQAIECIGRNQPRTDRITYFYIHTLSEDFTYAKHNQRILDQLCNPNQEESKYDELTKWRCFRALHNTQCIKGGCEHYVDNLGHWCHAEDSAHREIALDMIRDMLFPYNPPRQKLQHLLFSSNVLGKLDSALLLSINARDTLVYMELLWRLVEWICDDSEDSMRTLQALGSITPENHPEVPDSVWSLGLIARWLPKLKSVRDTDPNVVIQSQAVQHILRSYEKQWVRYGRRGDFGGPENSPSGIVERAAQRYQQVPDQCKQTPSVEAIHKFVFECVSEHRKQNGSAPLQPPPDIRIPALEILPDTLENDPVAPGDDASTQSRILSATPGADIC